MLSVTVNQFNQFQNKIMHQIESISTETTALFSRIKAINMALYQSDRKVIYEAFTRVNFITLK